MRSKLTAFGLLCVAAAVIAGARPAYAACDLPLSVVNASGKAKVLIILDSSGSMNEGMVADAYDASVTWSGDFTKTSSYYVSTAGNYTPSNFGGSWPTTPSAYLVNSDQGQRGQYNGNYLNWVYYHATTSERTGIPAFTRIQMAKQAVSTVINSGNGCDYGLMIFNGDNGGNLLAPIGTSVGTIQTQLNSVKAQSWTPLAETMVTALDYFKTTGVGAPLQASCEKLFIILATDGYPTHDLNVPAYLQDYDNDGLDPGTCTSLGAPNPDTDDCSGYVDDVADYMFLNDLRPDLSGVQNATTFVIGMNCNAPILLSTATEGGGAYFSVTNPTQLGDALNQTFNNIAAQMSSSSAVAVVSAENRTDNRLFRARYESASWKGFVESFGLPYATGASPLWEAGDLLRTRSAASRTIFTSTSGTNKVDLTTSNASSLVTPLAAADVTEASQIIDFTRGNDVAGMRSRGGWKLGDIVDSSPLMVGKPLGFKSYLNYSAFRSANAGRSEVLYVGANDGLLHCFDISNGNELWGYVPKSVLPRLGDLTATTYCHDYFVNMSPAAYDIYVNSAWKTVLVGGEERGGNGLFALDVTNPAANNVSVMWDVDLPELKGSWNTPIAVRDRTRNAHVLCVGTGLDATASQANLLALNPADGSVLSTFPLGSVVAGNKTTKATAIDTDFDGYDDLLFIGDLAGRMWRVNLNANPWSVSLFYDCGKPIQVAPVLTVDQQGRVMVLFGTGRYLSSADLSTTSQQTLYGLIDDNSGTAISTSTLVDQTSSISSVTSGQRGWYINLVQGSGERITRRPVLIAGTLYAPSFQPNTAACQGGGNSWLYSVDFKDGSAPSNANGTENNTTTGRVESMGTGILSDPSVDIVNEDLILQSSSTSLTTHGFNAGLKKLVVRSWRQKWN